MKSGPAPVAVFAYNRPDHLACTLRSLMACDGAQEAPITVFIDGPRSNGAATLTKEVRQVASTILGESADIRVAERNRGLANSIVAGVNELVAAHGCVIVVEDDLDLAPPFLTYMNAALERYWSDEQVFQISGHMFDVPEFADRRAAMFLPLTTTWGWATWARAWEAYDPAATGWEQLKQDRAVRRRFDLDGAYPYTWLMQRQQRGQSDSWGIRWYWSVFRRGGMSLFPPVSLVGNTGQDGSGTHGEGVVADFTGRPGIAVQDSPQIPQNVAVSDTDFDLVKKSIWRHNGSWKGWAINKVRQWIGI